MSETEKGSFVPIGTWTGVKIQKAKNGYVVSSYDDYTNNTVMYIAKTIEEAKELIGTLLGFN